MSDMKDTLLMDIDDDFEKVDTDHGGLLMSIDEDYDKVDESVDTTLLKTIK